MNEEIYVFKGRRGAPYHKFLSKLFLVDYENVVFQILSKSGNKWRILRLGGGQNSFWGPKEGRVAWFKKIEKSLYRTVVSTHSQNFSILAELKSV